MKFSDFKDHRDKRIIFINNCLLNQTSRAPGVAYRRGTAAELIQIVLDNGISIQQLPCLECIGIGGVSRKTFDGYFPLISHSLKYGWFPVLKLFFKVWLLNFAWLCRREAVQVTDRMDDLITEGYTIVGVVGMNDSPTCGVTKTLDFIEFTRLLALSEETGDTPRQIIQKTLMDGSSYFIGNLMKEARRRGIPLDVIGYEPWNGDPKKEAQRIAGLLKLAS